QNGDEQHQVYRVGAQGGWPEALTNKLDSQHNIAGESWSPDGKWIVYNANDQNPMNQDIILRNLETGETKRPLPTGSLYFPVSWSPDGKYVLVVDFKSNTNQDILLVEVENGTVSNATPHEGDIVFLPGSWSADSTGFYIVTNEGREFTGLGLY